MEEEFQAILLANSGVTAIAGTRVDWLTRVQGQGWPSLVLNLIGAAEGLTYVGPDGLQRGRVQVDCYGLTYAGAKGLARAVVARLNGYRGGRFLGIFHEQTREDREGGSNEAERPFRVSLDFMTNWR